MAAADLPETEDTPRRISGVWGSVPRAVLEAHFSHGLLGAAGRKADQSRVYNLAERLIPPEHFHRELPADEAQRELIRLAARAYGVATATDLADYYRMPVRDARLRVAELVERSELGEVRVEGWREPAYLYREASRPRRIRASALLPPFDPVVWYRHRRERPVRWERLAERRVPGGVKPNALTIEDAGSFVAPVRRLGKSPADAGYNVRWDLAPGASVGAQINVQDMAVLVSGPTGYPPMLGGQRAFGQACPFARKSGALTPSPLPCAVEGSESG